MNHTKSLITPSASILETIEVIDKSGLQVAIVVDKSGELLGTVTDGDVRRGILAGLTLQDSVHGIMNTSPITVCTDTAPTNIKEKMDEHKIRHIPIVNKKKQLVGLESLENLNTKLGGTTPLEYQNIPVILMLGGQGKRLRPLTDNIPKPMIHVGGKPLVQTIFENFIAQGFKKFIFSVNYKAEIIENHFGNGGEWGVSIEYVHEGKAMGTAGSLSLLPNPPTSPFIVMNGDLLTNISFTHLVNFHHQNTATATMCVREYTQELPYGVIENHGIELSNIVEKPQQSFFVNAGIYVLNPEVLNLIPEGDFFDMPTLFDAIGTDAHKRSTVFPIREYWRDIGRTEDLEDAQREYNDVFGKIQ